jgi:hypothetical protein
VSKHLRSRFTIEELARSNRTPAQTRGKLATWLLLAFFAFAALVAFQPTYVEVEIPVKPHASGGVWWEKEKSELRFGDEAGVRFLHRQVATVYPDIQGWKTVEETFAYFDEKLKERGWDHWAPAYSNPMLPESRFLDQANMRRYYHVPDDGTALMLAVWPIGGSVDGFNIVMVTERCSWLNQLSKGFD